jgi:hypothetical protein
VAATLTTATAAFVLLDSIMAVLVVYAAGFFVDEDFVGFSYCDKLVVSGVVASVGVY